MRNSLDAVADRDFALDYLYAAALLFTHLSRIGEEIVLWATAEFGFVRLPGVGGDRLVDDAAEAEPRRRRARARQGRHRDRPPDRAAGDASRGSRSRTTATCRRTSRRCSRRDATSRRAARRCRAVSGLEVDRDRLAAAASDPLLLATDAAEALVRDGMPFRDAHEQVAASVRDGSFKKPRKGATRASPGPGGIRDALDEVRHRFVDHL